MKGTTPSAKKLIGTWRSDRRRTLKDWIWKPDATEKNRNYIRKLFGNLTIHYTRTHINITFHGVADRGAYRVIGQDSESVALMAFDELRGEARILHLHFDGDNHYWITLGRQREWFRRIKPARRAR